jgi:hypothetical protein
MTSRKIKQTEETDVKYSYLQACRRILNTIGRRLGYIVSDIEELKRVRNAFDSIKEARKETETQETSTARVLVDNGLYARVNCPPNCNYRIVIPKRSGKRGLEVYCVCADFISREQNPNTPKSNPKAKKPKYIV